VEATAAHQVWRDGFGEMAGLVAGCFPRREMRQTFREMTEAMLMGVAQANCWTLAEAPGGDRPRLSVYQADRPRGPRRCQCRSRRVVVRVRPTSFSPSGAPATRSTPTHRMRCAPKSDPAPRRPATRPGLRPYAGGLRGAWSFVLASLARTWLALGCCRSSRMASACCQACRAWASSPTAWRVSPRRVRVSAS
jgi:hypothetical protein